MNGVVLQRGDIVGELWAEYPNDAVTTRSIGVVLSVFEFDQYVDLATLGLHDGQIQTYECEQLVKIGHCTKDELLTHANREVRAITLDDIRTRSDFNHERDMPPRI